jgi:hypothetical protein
MRLPREFQAVSNMVSGRYTGAAVHFCMCSIGK